MHNFQSFLKSTRESKKIQIETVANAINLSSDTIKIIEQANTNELLQTSNSLLKNQIRRYCEYLEVSEKKIVSMLSKLDILYYKKSRYGKLKTFDYINRLAILIIIIAIVFLGYQYVEKMKAIEESAHQNETSIIYTPVNYQADNSDNQSKSTTSTKAHPPATANMNNVVIDDNQSNSSTDNANVEKAKTKSHIQNSDKNIEDIKTDKIPNLIDTDDNQSNTSTDNTNVAKAKTKSHIQNSDKNIEDVKADKVPNLIATTDKSNQETK